MKKDIILNADSGHPLYTKANTMNALIHRSKHKAKSRSQAI